MATTVMVVEDEPNIGALVRTYLERAGYHALWVRSGEEALTELHRHPIALVILDIGLPGIDGYETARRIRAESWGKGLKLFALTGWGQDGARRASKEAGFDAHLVKPVDEATLRTALDAMDQPLV